MFHLRKFSISTVYHHLNSKDKELEWTVRLGSHALASKFVQSQPEKLYTKPLEVFLFHEIKHDFGRILQYQPYLEANFFSIPICLFHINL